MKAVYIKIVDHYENCLRKYGDNHRGVDWPKQDEAFLRYKIMLEIVPGDKKYTLLDFGCGAAHLYQYLVKSGYINTEYTGLDISSEFIDLCKKKYPEIPFLCLDILKSPDNVKRFDFIVLNGVFTEKRELSFDEMFEYFKNMIRTIFLKANCGIAFNVMSKHVDWEREDLFHLPFDLLASFLRKEVSKNFIIRNDYGLFEYTVYVFKESSEWHR